MYCTANLDLSSGWCDKVRCYSGESGKPDVLEARSIACELPVLLALVREHGRPETLDSRHFFSTAEGGGKATTERASSAKVDILRKSQARDAPSAGSQAHHQLAGTNRIVGSRASVNSGADYVITFRERCYHFHHCDGQVVARASNLEPRNVAAAEVYREACQ